MFGRWARGGAAIYQQVDSDRIAMSPTQELTWQLAAESSSRGFEEPLGPAAQLQRPFVALHVSEV